jgi:cytochrome P450
MPFAIYDMKVVLPTLFSQVRLARPAGARSRVKRYGLLRGPDDGARVIVRGSAAGS